MKKIIAFSIILIGILVLSSCIDASADNLTIELNPGVDTIQINDSFVDASASATYGFIDIDVTIQSNTVNTAQVGVYEIVYVATYKDVSKTITRIVTVVDEIAPVITLNLGVDTIVVGESWIDAGVTIIDNSQESINPEISGLVDETQVGEYVITYTAMDSSGNTSVAIRYVNVIASNLP